VVIDIVQTTDTVSGRFAVGDRAATEFFGWLELIDRLQSAAVTPPQEAKTASMDLYAIVRRRGWRSGADLEAAAARATRIGDQEMADEVRWIRSYVLEEADGSVGTLCLYEAASPDAIRRHAQRDELPVDEVIRVADTVVFRADPRSAAA
jgi:Protein of unknown function (DUF4242)